MSYPPNTVRNDKNYTEKANKLYKELSNIINDKELMDTALTHRSYSIANDCPNNERLEFLGDAVLELSITDCIFKQFSDFSEGKMSQIRAKLVDRNGLDEIARDMGLPDLIRLSKSEMANGGKEKKSIVSDCMESVIGAIYIKNGFNKTQELIDKIFSPYIDKIGNLKDPKSELQETTQKLWKKMPEYKTINVKGPDHSPLYRVMVTIGKLSSEAHGSSIKSAQENAAEKLLIKMRK